MTKRLLLALCCVLWAVTCYAQTTGQRPSPLGPGLCSNCATYNPGTQLPVPDQPIYPQLFYEAHATSCTVNSTCGSSNDSGKLLTATGASVTFTLPAPGAPGSAGYMFGYDGSHAYTITTTGGTIYGGCGTGTASVAGLILPALLTPDGTNWQCAPYGAVAAAAPAAIAFSGTADLGNGTGTSYTQAYTVGSGTNRFLLVYILGDVVGGVDDPGTITYAGTAMTQMVKNLAGAAGANRIGYLYGLAAPTPGSNNVVVNWGSSHATFALAADYTGVIQTTPTCDGSGTNNSGTTSVTTISNTLTTTVAGDWAVMSAAWAMNQPTATYSADTGFTFRVKGVQYGTPALFDSNATLTTGSHTVTVTSSFTQDVTSMICGLKHA
jgi:hypothetical protein